jgi:RimJ/RimL family protein N-acetyltransferase
MTDASRPLPDDVQWNDEDAGQVSERSKRFVPPTLTGRHIRLRTVMPEDYGHLQMLETSSELAPIWRLRGSTPNPQEWAHGLTSSVLAQFLVVSNRTEKPLGLVTLFNANFQDGHARLAAAQFDGHGRSPLMIFGFGLFVEYAFRCWSFRKLYMDVPEFNYPALASGLNRIFVVEGRLRDHYYLDGQLWDELILAIHRDSWEALAKRFMLVEQPV